MDVNILLTLVENDDILVEIQKILMRKEKLMEECGGKFRHKKSFSVVSNEILRNDTISLKAKGLYSLIQSYITLENFTLYKGFLLSKCKEGKKAFDSTWKELKESGYLVQYQMQDPETKQFCWEYELRDSVLEKPYTPNGGMGSDSHNPKRDDMASKIKKKADEFYLKLGKNEDILSYIGKHKTKQTICGFAMETENVIENAQNKFFKKNCDLLVVNDLFEDGAGFKTDTNKVALITKNFVDYLDLMSKEDLAHIILEKLMKVKGE